MMTATIAKEITTGYAEAILWEDGRPGKERCITENYKQAERGDVVELKSAPPWIDRTAKLPYLMVPVMFALGFMINAAGLPTERVAAGAVLALLTFGTAWIMTRRARMRRAMAWEVVRILEKTPV